MNQTQTAPARGAKITLSVNGMSCASCAGRVEKALGALPGVLQAQVNLALENASITYNDLLISPKGIAEAITDAGYKSDPPDIPQTQSTTWSRDLTELCIAATLSLPLLIQMVLVMSGSAIHLQPWMEFALAAPIQFYIGRRFYIGAWKALRARSGNMDQLVVLGTSAAFGYSVWIMMTRGAAATGALYFEASAVVITLILAGKVLEGQAKSSASAALQSLMALRPETVTALRDGVEIEQHVSQISLGETIVLRPGERAAVDGVIISGLSELDESLVTGEPMPVLRQIGETVMAGAINGTGRITIRADKIGENTTLARIAQMVADAQTGKAPIQRLVDQISSVFVPTVLLIATVTFSGWMIVGASFETALIAAISVLVIACPCALGLATPTALVAGTGVAAQAGILIQNIDTLERASRVNMVVFDKTGTLTQGRPKVTDIVSFDGESDALLALAASVQSGSEHPIGKSIVDAARKRDLALPVTKHIQATVGAGISGEVCGEIVRIGQRKFASPSDNTHMTDAAHLVSQGKTVVWVSKGGTSLGLIAVRDTTRDDAKDIISALSKRGIRTALLTGDNLQTAERIAQDLGLETVRANVQPADKAVAIKAWAHEGFHVAMVGDGINDAPALATAELGIAMGTGTGIALKTAGVTLMRPRLMLVDGALEIARATAAKIKQNLFAAFVYNVVLIPVAALGYLSPMMAGLAMALSSVSVVGNSLLLKRWKARV